MALNSTLNTAITQQFVRQFLAIQLELNSGEVIRLIDGSGVVTFDINGTATTFTGYDPVFGSLGTATSIQEKIADEAPSFSFTMLPPSPNALGTLAEVEQQNSPVAVWWGVVDDLTGQVIGSPETLWLGRYDAAKTTAANGQMAVQIETVSAWDRLFVSNEGQRLNPTWHKSIWPEETGLDFVTDASAQVFWGQDAPAGQGGTTTYSGGRGSGGGGRYCVTDDTLILLADLTQRRAADLVVGDMLWTRHEDTGEWGAYPIDAISFAIEPVFETTIAGTTIRATAGHRFCLGSIWVEMATIGLFAGSARVAKITVADAHTYVSAGVLSHNIKAMSNS